MDERLFTMLDKLDSRLDNIEEKLQNVDVRLAKYNSELEFHIARTNQIEDTLLPIVSHIEQVRGAVKLAAAIGSILAIVGAVGYLFK